MVLGADAAPDPKVREERPRVFIRARAWDGPSVEKLREFMKLDEYKRMARRLPDKIGHAVRYLGGDEGAGRKAVEDLKTMQIGREGVSPSYSGISAQRYAAMYDWLPNHPDMEDGATGGGTYGYHHEFTDLANLVAVWRSVTGL